MKKPRRLKVLDEGTDEQLRDSFLRAIGARTAKRLLYKNCLNDSKHRLESGLREYLEGRDTLYSDELALFALRRGLVAACQHDGFLFRDDDGVYYLVDIGFTLHGVDVDDDVRIEEYRRLGGPCARTRVFLRDPLKRMKEVLL